MTVKYKLNKPCHVVAKEAFLRRTLKSGRLNGPYVPINDEY